MLELNKEELKAVSRVRLYKTRYMRLFMKVWTGTLLIPAIALIVYLIYETITGSTELSEAAFYFIIMPIACIAIIGLTATYCLEVIKGKQIFKQLETEHNQDRS